MTQSPHQLDDLDRRIIAATQDGLPLVSEPYAAIGEVTGSSSDEVRKRLQQMLDSGVIRRIGAGGMGAVYLCERESDYRQQVAIKIVPTIFEHPEMLQRFRAERQMLADLDHPNIARLLDGGTTERIGAWREQCFLSQSQRARRACGALSSR